MFSNAWVRLIGINAVSLFCGVVANLSILLMAEEGNGYLAFLAKYNLQLITTTIIGGGCASVILVALVLSTLVELRLPYLAFTEAFYYAIISAALYFITTTLLIFTAYMLWRNRSSKEKISQVQFVHGHHRLVLLTVLFMAYILLGAVIFSRVEGWRYLDAVYWADVTILTIGFGDFKPSTNLGRALLLPYAIGLGLGWFITLKDWFNRRSLGKIPHKRKESLYGELLSSS